MVQRSEAGDRIRVLRVIARLNVGGPAIQAITLTQRLVARGYDTTLVRGREAPGEGTMDHLARELDVRPVFVPSLRRRIGRHDLAATLELRRLIRDLRPHVVHTHAAKAGALGRLAALLVARERRPAVTVHTFHGHVFTDYFSGWQTRLTRQVERWLGARTTRLVAVSEEVKQDLVRLRIAPPSRIEVIPLGFDLRPFALDDAARGRIRLATRERFGIGPDERVITIVARLVPIKRIDRFLRIARRLSSLDDVRFMVVGDGELAPELHACADARALGRQLVWTGIQHDMPAVYGASDVVVLTSDNEGTPVSLIEAQAAGLATVATDVGGVRSVVADQETGMLLNRADEEGFAHAVRRLLDDPALAARIGTRARQSADRFQLPRLVDDLDGLYRRLLAESRRP